MPEYVPLVAVDDTTVNACQALHVTPSVESLYWSSYPVIVLPVPLDAPDQVSVSVVSTIDGASVTVVGAPHAVEDAHCIELDSDWFE
jgi:hypothetical protein